ncbi:MAG: hypothetical protein A2092_13055 [Rhodobacteraceae bacterium GWE1_64_9]|nr:MAG: hypothetical protein A2092_13055 [Rhodobacteraceae bacterium GWE1_64_9]
MLQGGKAKDLLRIREAMPIFLSSLDMACFQVSLALIWMIFAVMFDAVCCTMRALQIIGGLGTI